MNFYDHPYIGLCVCGYWLVLHRKAHTLTYSSQYKNLLNWKFFKEKILFIIVSYNLCKIYNLYICRHELQSFGDHFFYYLIFFLWEILYTVGYLIFIFGGWMSSNVKSISNLGPYYFNCTQFYCYFYGRFLLLLYCTSQQIFKWYNRKINNFLRYFHKEKLWVIFGRGWIMVANDRFFSLLQV